jgi:hypothetical protein
MPYIQAIIPIRGWVTDVPYSGVPEGYTHDILDMIPADSFRRRIRLGTRPGFNRLYKFDSGSVQCIVRTNAFSGIPPVIRDRMLVVNSGKIYYMDPGGNPQQVLGPASSTAACLNTTARVEGVQRGQYCYFVDGTNYIKVDLFASPPAWSLWNHASLGPEDHVKNVIGGVTYTATIIALYGSRLVLGGVKQLENVWFMSQIDEPDHWVVVTGNAEDAIAGNDGQWGIPGDEIIALIPFGQGSIIFAGKKSMSMLTQDPIFGSASIQQMSRTVGICGPRGWCNGPEKSVFVLSQDGLYRLNPNDFNVDRGQLISRDKLDSFFANLKWEDISPSITYDVERRGVWIFLTRTDQPSSSTHLFYSEQTDGFFPFKMYDPRFYGAFSQAQMLTDDGRVQVALFGSSTGQLGIFDSSLVVGIDGYVAAGYDPADNPDIGDAAQQRIQGSVSIGPIVSSSPGLAFCNEVQIELGADIYLPDTDVKGIAAYPTVQILSAATAQEAIASNLNTLVITQVLFITAGGGFAPTFSATATYDGGGISPTITDYVDGAYATSATGLYTSQDTFVSPLLRVFENPTSQFQLTRGSIGGATRWFISFQVDDFPVYVQQQVNGAYPEDPSLGEYRFTNIDSTGAIVATVATDTVSVTTSQFEGATVTDIGNIAEGANNRLRCRVRDNAMFVRVRSSGYPFAFERMGLNIQVVGPRRTVRDV